MMVNIHSLFHKIVQSKYVMKRTPSTLIVPSNSRNHSSGDLFTNVPRNKSDTLYQSENSARESFLRDRRNMKKNTRDGSVRTSRVHGVNSMKLTSKELDKKFIDSQKTRSESRTGSTNIEFVTADVLA